MYAYAMIVQLTKSICIQKCFRDVWSKLNAHPSLAGRPARLQVHIRKIKRNTNDHMWIRIDKCTCMCIPERVRENERERERERERTQDRREGGDYHELWVRP